MLKGNSASYYFIILLSASEKERKKMNKNMKICSKEKTKTLHIGVQIKNIIINIYIFSYNNTYIAVSSGSEGIINFNSSYYHRMVS